MRYLPKQDGRKAEEAGCPMGSEAHFDINAANDKGGAGIEA